MGSTFIPFEDTPAWESGLRVHEAENKWLLREVDAVLASARAYARSLTSSGGMTLAQSLESFAGAGSAGESVVDAVGGMLAGALAGMESFAIGGGTTGGGDGGAGSSGSSHFPVPGTTGSEHTTHGGTPGASRESQGGAPGGGVGSPGDDARRHAPAHLSASAEAAFAAALERIGTVATSNPEEDEMAAPMAAAIGAPLLTPVADALRAVGSARDALGRRVDQCLVSRLEAFIDEDLAAAATMRARFDRARAACDAARARYLSCRGDGRATEAKRLERAKEALEAARARLTLATVHVEGRRRYVLLEAARETAAALSRFFEDGAAAMQAIAADLGELEEYEMASRAQAEMKMVSAARRMEAAFGGLSGAEEEEMDRGGGERGRSGGDEDKDSDGGGGVSPRAFGVHDGWAGGAVGDRPNGGWEEAASDAGGGGRRGTEEMDGGGPASGFGGGASSRFGREGGARRDSCQDASALDGWTSAGHEHGMNTGRSTDASIRKCLAEGQAVRETNRGLGLGVIRRGYLSQRVNGKWSAGVWTRRYFVLDSAGQLTVHSAVGVGRRATRSAPSHARAIAARSGPTQPLPPKSPNQPAAAAAATSAPVSASMRAEDGASSAASGNEEEEEEEERWWGTEASTYSASPPDRGVLVPMAATAMKSVGWAAGAAWSFVAKGAAPDPAAHAEGGGKGGELGGGESSSEVQVAVDLTVSCVKAGADPSDRSCAGRPFCFRIISPAAALLLQAESEEEMQAWIRDLQGVIAELISLGPTGTKPLNDGGLAGEGAGGRDGGDGDVRETLAVVPGNSLCADCGRPNPDWASLNLCVLICQRCSGVHRHLGAHVSKVRSTSLDRDAWTEPVRALFAAIGNDAANDVWEAKRREGTVAPRGNKPVKEEEASSGDFTGESAAEHPPPVAAKSTSFEEALDAIAGKYVRREHVRASVALGAMEEAAAALDCIGVLRRLATTGSTSSGAGETEKNAALLAAVRRGEEGGAVVALLLSNGARIDGGFRGGEGEVLAVVMAAMAAGCQLEGTVVGLLRTAAEIQGVLFNVPPAAGAAGAAGGCAGVVSLEGEHEASDEAADAAVKMEVEMQGGNEEMMEEEAKDEGTKKEEEEWPEAEEEEENDVEEREQAVSEGKEASEEIKAESEGQEENEEENKEGREGVAEVKTEA